MECSRGFEGTECTKAEEVVLKVLEGEAESCGGAEDGGGRDEGGGNRDEWWRR